MNLYKNIYLYLKNCCPSGEEFTVKMPTGLKGSVSAMIKRLKTANFLGFISLYIFFPTVWLAASLLSENKSIISVTFATTGKFKKWNIGNPKSVTTTVMDLQGTKLQAKHMPFILLEAFSEVYKAMKTYHHCPISANEPSYETVFPILHSSLGSFFYHLCPIVLPVS